MHVSSCRTALWKPRIVCVFEQNVQNRYHSTVGCVFFLFLSSYALRCGRTFDYRLHRIASGSLYIDMLFAAANTWFSLFARICEYANIRRIVRILLVQFGKGFWRPWTQILLVFRVYLHYFSMQDAENAINLTYFWGNWRFRFSRMDPGSSQAHQEAKTASF